MSLIFVGQSLYLFEVLPHVIAIGLVGCTCSLRHLDTCLGDQTTNKLPTWFQSLALASSAACPCCTLSFERNIDFGVTLQKIVFWKSSRERFYTQKRVAFSSGREKSFRVGNEPPRTSRYVNEIGRTAKSQTRSDYRSLVFASPQSTVQTGARNEATKSVRVREVTRQLGGDIPRSPLSL